jgi:hypothetical protein
MEPLEEGTKISLLVSDEWITGTFLGFIEEAEQVYYCVDIGRPSFRRINSGYVQEIEVGESAKILDFSSAKKRFAVVR